MEAILDNKPYKHMSEHRGKKTHFARRRVCMVLS